MPGPEQDVLCELFIHAFSEQLYEIGSTISSVSHMGKLKHREFK